MSVEFLKDKKNASNLALASKQQEQINYFIQSSIQKEITQEYLTNWANRQYKTNDAFHNWLKTILKTDNFLSIYKYLRYPLSSAKLVNDEIKPQLKRVFHAEDSYSKYTIRGKNYDSIPELKSNEFNEIIFDALFFRYNDIIITDLKDTNKPFRYLLEIDDVISIESHHNVIKRIGFEAEMNGIDGFLYIDDKNYIFYDSDYKNPITVPHDLGVCPADYIEYDNFDCESDIVKKSLFSYVKPELEEYVFLKTLQRMTNANGVLPVVTKLKTSEKTKQGNDVDKASDTQPMSSNAIGSQQASVAGTMVGSNSPLQAGTIISVPQVKKNDNSLDMDIVKNFLNFFYLPVEASEFLNKRILELKKEIIKSVVGDFQEQTNTAQNELQVSTGYISRQDRLRNISQSISKVRNNSDLKFLGLQYGINNVSVEVFEGSDFFLETQQELFELFKLSPNPIERKNVLVRSSQNKNKFNPSKAKRERLLYDLLPYASDIDFDKALSNNLVSNEVKVLQTQFIYYINLFEAKYGDINEFYDNIQATNSERLIIINNLIYEMIVPIEQTQQLTA